MTTKSKVLELLEKDRGKSRSGEEIAGQLGISRTAVWKAIKSLKQDGYYIKSSTNSGYLLTEENNILSIEGLLPYLLKEEYAKKIYIHKLLESTNKTAKEMAINGYEHGTLIIADAQNAGKGRYNRSFYSPPGGGLYMSIILRLKSLEITNPTLITVATAVLVCRAIKKVSERDPKIKWVNDIFLDNKKICGILTEAVTDFESGNIDWIVVGIGININTDDFPNELKQVAGSIYENKADGVVRNRIAAEIINTFLSSNAWFCEREVYEEYRNRMDLLGQSITVIQMNETYIATAIDVDEQGRLIVKKEDGTVLTLSSGEVSIRKLSKEL